MTAFWATAALIVPWAAGSGIVAALRDRGTSRFLIVGAGWLAGQAMMMALLFASFASGSSHARMLLALMALIAAVLWFFAARSRFILHSLPSVLPSPPHGFHPSSFILLIIGAGLLIKLYLLAGAHAFVPARCDDAVSIWLFKAKVIASLDQLFQPSGHPYDMGGSNPHYAVFVSLVAAWVPLVVGRWHEQLATLPWLFYFVNLVLLTAGGLRRWLSSTQAWIAAYIVGSLPLLIIHVYRPGYADLILAAFLASTVLFLLMWQATGMRRHLCLAGMFVLVTACLKRESAALAAITVFVLLLTSWRLVRAWSRRTRAVVAVATATIGLLVFALVDFSEQTDATAALGYHSDVWPRLCQHVLGWSSFHFLFWGLLAATVHLVVRGSRAWRGGMGTRSPGEPGRSLPVDGPSYGRNGSSVRNTAVLLALALCGFQAAVFLFTDQARFALNDQTPSRLFMQLAPALILVFGATMSPNAMNRRTDS
ncbi:MAG: hypothetical protein ABII12_01905 [Planctomycetota bacterium]